MSLLKLTLLSLAAFTLATPVVKKASPVEALAARDSTPACYPETMPIGKAVSTCPKKTTLDSNGHCSAGIGVMPGDNGCDSYCEQTLTAVYGREVPFHVGVCQNATTCLVATGETVTYTNTYTIDIGFTGSSTKRDEEEPISRRDDAASIFTAAFNIGASYSWSKSVGYTTTTTFSKTLDGTTCGYWTFIPYLTTSCGVLTEAAETTTGAGYYDTSELTTCNTKKLTDQTNYCNTTPYYDANNKADGVVVFVYANCDTGTPLTTGQDAAYNYPGVSAQSAPA
ncbi:hypothetical protein LSUE1_G007533 [Lachnellula suecica]|uniref:Uncharacterized protein n=1 Tax=Lachnellula suecica TaxID=602035 RepID=A0A8T9BVB9_9HELO|nr:hypothetical protein LSUE1_G007533 [Lachnellula suecica]